MGYRCMHSQKHKLFEKKQSQIKKKFWKKNPIFEKKIKTRKNVEFLSKLQKSDVAKKIDFVGKKKSNLNFFLKFLNFFFDIKN